MSRDEVEKIRLGPGQSTDIPTGRPAKFPILGLPDHLEASIVGRYQYELRRRGDSCAYRQSWSSSTPEGALQALKNLLNWDPV